MTNEKLTLVVIMRAKPGLEGELKRDLLALIEPTHAEEGCITYDLHISTDDERVFVFHETWASRAALDRHMESPHVLAFFRKMDELLEVPAEIYSLNRIP